MKLFLVEAEQILLLNEKIQNNSPSVDKLASWTVYRFIFFVQVTFQFSFWDKFKIINDLAAHSIDNLSRLMAHLVASRALSLSILKVFYVLVPFVVVQIQYRGLKKFGLNFRCLMLDCFLSKTSDGNLFLIQKI